jgi:hypothetical protein
MTPQAIGVQLLEGLRCGVRRPISGTAVRDYLATPTPGRKHLRSSIVTCRYHNVKRLIFQSLARGGRLSFCEYRFYYSDSSFIACLKETGAVNFQRNAGRQRWCLVGHRQLCAIHSSSLTLLQDEHRG